MPQSRLPNNQETLTGNLKNILVSVIVVLASSFLLLIMCAQENELDGLYFQ
jgi:hypothetical protein